MKNSLFFFLVLLIVSCSDGDLQIEAIDFDDIAVQNCETLSVDTQLLFKIDDNQALILQLEDGLLQNEISTDTIISNIDNDSELTYRLFNNTVSSSYFCDDIPPATPSVIEDIEAIEGEVLIVTTSTDLITFNHEILLRGIIITNEAGESIIDLTTTCLLYTSPSPRD